MIMNKKIINIEQLTAIDTIRINKSSLIDSKIFCAITALEKTEINSIID